MQTGQFRSRTPVAWALVLAIAQACISGAGFAQSAEAGLRGRATPGSEITVRSANYGANGVANPDPVSCNTTGNIPGVPRTLKMQLGVRF